MRKSTRIVFGKESRKDRAKIITFRRDAARGAAAAAAAACLCFCARLPDPQKGLLKGVRKGKLKGKKT